VRVSDPFEETEIGRRKALIYTACALVLVVAYTLAFPRQVAIVAVILAFFAIIMMHEYGHYLMARRADMKVTEFFVGFGPRLWSKQRGETEFGVKALPLGGYCKIIGMNSIEEVDPADEDRTYRAKNWHQKVLMAFGGPATHFILAIVLMFVVLLAAGDRNAAYQTTTLESIGLGAEAAGLQAGDRVVSVAGTPVQEWSQVTELVRGTADAPRRAGESVTFVVQRGDQTVSYDVVLREDDAGDGTKVVRAGIASKVVVPRVGPVEAAVKAPAEVADLVVVSVKGLGEMFSPSGISNYLRILSGDQSENTDPDKRFVSVVGFGQLSAQAVDQGWVTVLLLLISINVFVGLINLVPLVPFDGGHIAVATYEAVMSKVRRRRVQVDMNKLVPVTVAVLAVFAFIFVTSLFLDITNPIKIG